MDECGCEGHRDKTEDGREWMNIDETEMGVN